MPSISIPTAALVVGGLTAASGIASAVIGGNAAKSAAQTQANAATAAAASQQKMFEDNKALLQPFVGAGVESLDVAKGLMGLPGTNGVPDSAAIQSTLEATPGYAFTKQQGLESVQNSYAASGLASSGAALKGAAQFATGLANSTYEQRLQDYLGLAGSGQNAASNVANLGASAALAASNYNTSGAAATAAGTVGAANALTSGINTVASGLGSSVLLGALNANGAFGKRSFNPLSVGGSDSYTQSTVKGTALQPVDMGA